MQCKLCHLEAELRNSHVIPEFHYVPLYDKKHRFHIISTNLEKKEGIEQKGIREKLLCDKCEQRLSRWESYAKKVIFDEESFLVGRNGNIIRIGGIKYKEFKLYLLSLIWRMGISSLDAFSEVSLGPYEEKLRTALLNENPGSSAHYPVLLTAVLFEKKFRQEWILPPELVKVGNKHCYRFLLSGVLYSFFVTDKKFLFDVSKASINEDGTFLMNVEHLENIPFLLDRVIAHSKVLNLKKIA